jgi:AbrB family looped-hinge helix DNA binding protein
MTTVKIGQRGVITLPKKMRERIGAFEGEVLSVQEKNGTLVLAPKGSDDPVLAAVRTALEDIKRGDYIEFGSLEEFDRELKKYNKRHDGRKTSR